MQGTAPTRSTVAENAVAMGVDVDHMGWPALAQSVPPVMAQLVSLQMAMHVAHERYSVPVITFDQMLVSPRQARRTMARWFRGAGDDAVDAGVELVGRHEPTDTPVADAVEAATISPPPDSRWEAPPPPTGGKRSLPPSALVADWTREAWALPEALWREVYYSYAGNHSRSVLEPGAPWWLGAMHLHPPAAASEVGADS